MIGTGVWLASKYSDQATQSLGETGTAVQETTSSLEAGQSALDQYNDQIAKAAEASYGLEDATTAVADAQGALADGIAETTEAVIVSTSAARGLAIVLGDLMGYVATFPGGMSMEQLNAFWTKGETHAIPWENWFDYWYGGGEKPDYQEWIKQFPSMQHGGMLNEPTLLWGMRSRRLLGTAAERGPERVGEPGGVSIVNTFQGPWVIREEADVDKVARRLLELQTAKFRSRGIK
jgi:hypothetical protein